jgi:hypothetical protein
MVDEFRRGHRPPRSLPRLALGLFQWARCFALSLEGQPFLLEEFAYCI